MAYLGAYAKKSTIFIELLIKDDSNHPINMEDPPIAIMERRDMNGITKVDSVKLKIEEDGKYTYVYQIPENWKNGKYTIRYQASIQNQQYELEDEFDCVSNVEESSVHILADTNTEENITNEILLETQENQYVYPPAFQTPASIEVQGNEIIIKLQEEILYNHNFMVVLDSSIQSINGHSLPEAKILTFSSEYRPLYATPMEVHAVLKELAQHFQLNDIYIALRDAGQKAHQLTGQIPDPNNARYRPMRERDEAYFPTTKYVLYEACQQLISSFMVNVVNHQTGNLQNNEQIGGDSISLGDFSIKNESSGGGSSNGDQPDPLKQAKALLENIQQELTFWKDAMMGYNARGYARPIHAITRSNTPGPGSRDI